MAPCVWLTRTTALEVDISNDAARTVPAIPGAAPADVAVLILLGSQNVQLAGSIDVLLLNSPNMPSEDCEFSSGSTPESWAGILNGRRIIDWFQPTVARTMSSYGACHIVLLKGKKPCNLSVHAVALGLEMMVHQPRPLAAGRL
jgi:hypothetical protein